LTSYKEIQDFIRNKHGYNAKSCWIAHAKEVYGVPVKRANNRVSDKRLWPCPKKKLEHLKDAFAHFEMI